MHSNSNTYIPSDTFLDRLLSTKGIAITCLIAAVIAGIVILIVYLVERKKNKHRGPPLPPPPSPPSPTPHCWSPTTIPTSKYQLQSTSNTDILGATRNTVIDIIGLTVTNSTIAIPAGSQGLYLLTYSVVGNSTPGLNIIVTGTTNVTGPPVINKNANGIANLNSTSAVFMVYYYFFLTDPTKSGLITFSAAKLPDGIKTGDLQITQVNSGISTIIPTPSHCSKEIFTSKYQLQSVSNTSVLGDARVTVIDIIGPVISNSTIAIPAGLQGLYLLTYSVVGNSTPNLNIIVTGTKNVTGPPVINKNANGIATTDSTSTTFMLNFYFYLTDPTKGGLITFSGATLPDGIQTGDLQITQVNSLIM